MRSTRCIECEELEVARVRDARPVQRLDLNRRELLQGGIAGVASVYGLKALGVEEIWESVAHATPSEQNVLVLLYLAGGNDGLNTLVPADGDDYAAYLAARPTIGRQVADLATDPMPGTGGLLRMPTVVTATGNGGTGGFDTLYGDGTAANSRLAVLPAVDYTPANFSHFTSSDLWFAGSMSAMTTGWLGRWIDRNGSPTNPLQAISIDEALSKAIRSAVNPVCAIPSTSALGFSTGSGGYRMPPGSGTPPAVNGVMSDIGAAAAGPQNLYLGRSRSTYARAVDIAGQRATIDGQPATAADYPANSRLATRLKLAARLIEADLGTRVITIHWGSFDTHGSQLAAHDPQLRELSRCLAAFQADLAARAVDQRVATLAFSEFGRRVGENGSDGTDHGAGGLVLLSGSTIRGGLASEFPGCQPAEVDGGNVKVTTDFRSVYQSVLTEWLGGDLDGVLPGGPFPAIQREDGGNALFT